MHYRNPLMRPATWLPVAAWILVCVMPSSWQVVRAAEPDDAQPRLAILPRVAPAPKDNPTTADKVALGKQLFFDPRLSGDNQMSCATCHDPAKAWGDGRKVGRGAGDKDLARNTPSLLNVGFYESLFWDGRVKTLEEQALLPIQAEDEMNQSLDELEKELADIPGYARRFQQVFGAGPSREGVAKALAAFQRTLVSRNSPLDRYLAGDKTALTALQQYGLDLFVGEADCIRCHHGPMLSDGKYYRTGSSFQDKGRGAVTGKREDSYRFRTSTLRDLSRTGPYMHDGSLDSAYYVVAFYLRSVPIEGPGGLPLDVESRQGVSFNDVEALTAFLKALDGEPPKIRRPRLP